jgi:radical SAM-linked protein
MREERLVALRGLGAHKAPAPTVLDGALNPLPAGATIPAGSLVRSTPAMPASPSDRKGQKPRASFEQVGDGTRYRVSYTKQGRAAFVSHLDTYRLLQRMIRRAGLDVLYTRGFHPKPDMTLGPALALGIASLGELFDVRLVDGEAGALSADEVCQRLRAAAPDGIRIHRVVSLGLHSPGVAKVIGLADWAALVPASLAARLATLPPVTDLVSVRRMHRGEAKTIPVSQFVVSLATASTDEAARLRTALDWPAGDSSVLVFRTRIQGDGGVKPSEVIESALRTVYAVSGATSAASGALESPDALLSEHVRLARLGLYGSDGDWALDPCVIGPAVRVPGMASLSAS